MSTPSEPGVHSAVGAPSAYSARIARIVFASAAYLGDVAPYVAPANLLASRGHDVTYLTPVGFHHALRGERFALAEYALDFSPSGMRDDGRHERLMKHPFVNQVRLGRYWMGRGFADDPDAGRRSLLEHLAGADVVVSHPTFGSAVIPAAQHLGIPTVAAQLFPMMIPTASAMPPLGKSSPSLGKSMNRAAWKLFGAGSGLGLNDRTMNAFRRELGLRPMRGNALLAWTHATRAVMLVSRHYFGASPPDWPPMTWAGFSAWAGPPDRQAVDPAVDAYLDKGEPPVLVTLGSSAATGAASAFERIRDDLAARGMRSLLLVGNQHNLTPSLQVGGGAFEFAPLAHVLPRCRAAVVSGALGSVAAVLTAGRPVVVAPQLFDQVWHGGQVERLGVGRLAWRAGSVGKAVSRLLADASYSERAQALGAKLAAEDGAPVLADEVESLL